MARNKYFLLLFIFILFNFRAHGQQDVTFHLAQRFFNGAAILKVKRDFNDPYLWVLGPGNKVYRINSQTFAINDFSSVFSAYNSLQFVDIAGTDQNTVFIATNSTNLIEYQNGALKLIGAEDGIPGTVNSVGINNIPTTIQSAFPIGVVMIGTDKGFRTFDPVTQTIGYGYENDNGDGSSKIYEATYRTMTFKDSSKYTADAVTNDTVSYQPVRYLAAYGPLVTTFFWEGGKSFAGNINTGLIINDSLYGYAIVFANNFWGDSHGMYQAFSNFSYYSILGTSSRYLNNIAVNKITSIYGLTSFGSSFQFTNPGLIKQNLLIGTNNGLYFSNNIYENVSPGIYHFSLFHDDELGNITINDICVNASSTQAPICENGVWVAANDGLYYLQPDYAAFLNVKQINGVGFSGYPNTLSSLQICPDGSATATVLNSVYSGNSVQWYKNGQELPGESATSININTAGDYYAVLYDPCENIHLESNHLTVQVASTPVFTFNYPDQLQYCAGTSVTLTANGSSNYQYQWYQDGTAIDNATSASFNPVQTGKYKVEVSSCPDHWVSSKEVQVNFMNIAEPGISDDKTVYCQGDMATLSVNVQTDPSYTINWYQNGNLIGTETNKTSIATSDAGDYTVSVTNNSANTDGSFCSAASMAKTIAFNPLPTINLHATALNGFCLGQTITLTAQHSDGAVQWSDGETGDQIQVTKSGNYTATVTSPSGCSSFASLPVTIYPDPDFTLSDASICPYDNKSITLQAPPGYAVYSWDNGASDQPAYQVSRPGTVSLTVTDINGCQAVRTLNVIEKCPEVHIPNTFTPNGDGVNDTWDIQGLDASSMIKVFTRWGTEIYQSTSYNTPWDGEYNGKKLPAGVYYYIVTARNNTEKFSGALTIIY